jgi:hypothetical protein
VIDLGGVEPISLTAYAKRRGVSQVAVTKAVASGRLSQSVTRDERGAPKIADPDLADREWAENTAARGGNIVLPPPPPPPNDAASAPAAHGYHESRARKEAAEARRSIVMADMAELDLAKRRGALIDVEKARRDVFERYTIVRTRLLGIPTKIAQRLPHAAAELVPLVEELLREALEDLADGRC